MITAQRIKLGVGESVILTIANVIATQDDNGKPQYQIVGAANGQESVFLIARESADRQFGRLGVMAAAAAGMTIKISKVDIGGGRTAFNFDKANGTPVPVAAKPAPTSTKQPVSIGLTGDASLDQGVDPIRQELESGEQWAELRRKYGECLSYVVDNVVPVLIRSEVGTDPASVLAAVHTLLIARNDRGI